jgi:hypothetical protein
MISLSIDVTLLDKARYKKITRKNGKEAVFCDLILFETPDSAYGDFMVKQSVTKEEREARIEMPILGNGKTIGTQAAKPKAKAQEPSPQAANDDVPF